MRNCFFILIGFISPLLLIIFWKGDIWKLKQSYLRKPRRIKSLIYYSYMQLYNCSIGIESNIVSPPVFPHGISSIFISDGANIGKGAVIFQQVTIGSNMLSDSERQGSPTIGENVYIGAGAKIIGRVTIGNNVRIGANAVVVKDIPDNSVVVIEKIKIIEKSETLDNRYISRAEWMSK